MPPNNRVQHAHGVRSTHNGEAPLFAAHADRLLTQMDYQLVIKFWRKSLEDETFLVTIQDELKRLLGDAVKLDGYDVSDDEINLFVLTPDPKHSFRRIKTVLEKRGIVRGVSAASRLVGGAHFTSIWPILATRKFKLPSK